MTASYLPRRPRIPSSREIPGTTRTFSVTLTLTLTLALALTLTLTLTLTLIEQDPSVDEERPDYTNEHVRFFVCECVWVGVYFLLYAFEELRGWQLLLLHERHPTARTHTHTHTFTRAHTSQGEGRASQTD